MIAFFRDGRPSVGVYLTSPPLSLEAALRMAVIGARFFGSPMPRLITSSPRSRRIRASSLSLSVGDSAIDRASRLRLMRQHLAGARPVDAGWDPPPGEHHPP